MFIVFCSVLVNGFGGSVTGGSVTGGSVTGGSVTGGSVTGGSVTGGSVTGGSVTGGSDMTDSQRKNVMKEFSRLYQMSGFLPRL